MEVFIENIITAILYFILEVFTQSNRTYFLAELRGYFVAFDCDLLGLKRKKQMIQSAFILLIDLKKS